MLSFLKSTEVNRFLPKEKLIDKLDLSSALKESLKDDVRKFTITNELSPKSMNIVKGENVPAVFVMEVQLKRKDIDYRLIEAVAKQNKNKILFVLRYEDKVASVDLGQFAVFYGKLYRSEWIEYASLSIDVNGANFDVAWDGIVGQVALVRMETDKLRDTSKDLPIDEQLARQEELARLEKEIERLERLARNELQPKRKFELVGKIGELKRKLEGLE